MQKIRMHKMHSENQWKGAAQQWFLMDLLLKWHFGGVGGEIKWLGKRRKECFAEDDGRDGDGYVF